MASTTPVSTLRAYLLSSLVSLPASRTLHLHLLVSTPRKPGKSPFLYASTRPKCLVQDVLVLLSEQISPERSSTSASSTPDAPIPRTFVSAIEASVYTFPASDSTILYVSKVDGTGQGAYPSPTSTLLRAFLVFYASHQSPLYPSPATHHLWIHLFARAQRQYLFPNSGDYPHKKPLGDVALCKWWKKILSDVTKHVEAQTKCDDGGTSDSVALGECSVSLLGSLRHERLITVTANASGQSIRLYYILPGQTEAEASSLLRDSRPYPHLHAQWIYSHPYMLHTDMDIPCPSGSYPSSFPGQLLLAALIPHFEDDPKSRFLDELAATSEEQAVAVPVPTPRKKRPKNGKGEEEGNSTLGHPRTGSDSVEFKGERAIGVDARAQVEAEEPKAHLSLLSPPAIIYNPPSSSPAPADTHSPPPRPSTPESIQHTTLLSSHTPHLPTFPDAFLSPHRNGSPGTSSQTPTPRASLGTPQTPRTPRRPKSDLDTVSPAEFWERMSYRQECAVGAVTGFFVAVFSRRCDSTATHGRAVDSGWPSDFNSQNSNTGANVKSPLLSAGTVPHSILKRVMSSLLTGVEFSTVERAHKATNVIESAIKGLCEGLGPGKLPDGQPVAKKPAEQEAQVEVQEPRPDVYASHVYASLAISNPPLARKPMNNVTGTSTGATASVNILGVRRKKKREE